MPQKADYYSADKSTPSNAMWFPWLSRQLMSKDIFPIAPEMPSSWRPRYHLWEQELERFEIDEETDLVGHSCGGGFLLRWLSQNPQISCNTIALVAPWINPSDDSDVDVADFFNFDIDPNIPKRVSKFVIFNSLDDHSAVLKTVGIIMSKLKDISYREFSDKGHFTSKSLGGDAFPELLEELIP